MNVNVSDENPFIKFQLIHINVCSRMKDLALQFLSCCAVDGTGPVMVLLCPLKL